MQMPGQHHPALSPMLCPLCLQVVEISSLTEHLLTECDQKDSFGRCYRCSEAISKEELPRHVKTRDCNRECLRTSRPQTVSSPGAQLRGWGSGPVSASAAGAPATTRRSDQKSLSLSNHSAAKSEKLANRCPLCHENFSPGEEVRGGREGADVGQGLVWGRGLMWD